MKIKKIVDLNAIGKGFDNLEERVIQRLEEVLKNVESQERRPKI